MATITINLAISGDTASAVSVLTLSRSDTGQPPAGVSLPIALSSTGNGGWSGSFADGTPAPFYNYTYDITWTDNTTTGPYAGTVSGTSPAGYYASQTSVQNVFGVNNVAIWSNRDDTLPPINGVPQSDPVQVAAALARTDAFVNWLASVYKYATPIPTTIAQWTRLNNLASEDAGIELYLGRGVYDKGDELAGKFEERRGQLRGFYQGKTKIPGEIEQFFIEGIPDAPRVIGTINKSPSIILSPVVFPYGSNQTGLLQPNQIPLIP